MRERDGVERACGTVPIARQWRSLHDAERVEPRPAAMQNSAIHSAAMQNSAIHSAAVAEFGNTFCVAPWRARARTGGIGERICRRRVDKLPPPPRLAGFKMLEQVDASHAHVGHVAKKFAMVCTTRYDAPRRPPASAARRPPANAACRTYGLAALSVGRIVGTAAAERMILSARAGRRA